MSDDLAVLTERRNWLVPVDRKLGLDPGRDIEWDKRERDALSKVLAFFDEES